MSKRVPKRRFKGFEGEWEEYTLGNITTSYSGGTPLVGKTSYYNGNIPFIRSSEINSDTTLLKISDEGLVKSSAKMVNKGTILYALYGATSGEVGISKIEGAINQAILAIIPDDDFSSETIMQWLRLNKKNITNVFLQGGQGNLSGNILKSLELQLPSKTEQEKLGDYFKNLDNLINLHQQKYDKLQALKKAYLYEMFPQEGESVPKRRFAGFSGEWEKKVLNNIVNGINRVDATSKAPVMMITAQHGFIKQSERYSFDNAGESLKKYIILNKGELAYNHGASKVRPYGSCFALKEEYARVPFVYHCFSVKENNSEFISIVLNSKNVERQLKKLITSGARLDGLLNISFKEYCTVEILVPDITEQNKIADFFEIFDQHISEIDSKLQKLKALKQAYLAEMFV